jgi:hypothetical protein
LQEHVFDAAMVGQAVQHRGCHFGVSESLRPAGEGEICGDQQRGVFVPPIKIALRLASRKAPAANSRTSASSITVSAKLNLARHHPPAGFYLNSSQLLSKLRAPPQPNRKPRDQTPPRDGVKRRSTATRQCLAIWMPRGKSRIYRIVASDQYTPRKAISVL